MTLKDQTEAHLYGPGDCSAHVWSRRLFDRTTAASPQRRVSQLEGDGERHVSMLQQYVSLCVGPHLEVVRWLCRAVETLRRVG
jgi:hypothetical protein